jgi:hypothetical protein
MPFQSEKQRRYLWANEPEIARDWTDRYGAAGGGIMRIPLANGSFKNWLGDVTGYTQHNIDNQKLRNALANKEITEKQYKRMGGWDVAKNMPLNLGSNYKNVGIASGAYNTMKSIGNLFNAPGSEYSDIGALESIALNTQGATGLGKKDQMMYDDIVGGKKFFSNEDEMYNNRRPNKIRAMRQDLKSVPTHVQRQTSFPPAQHNMRRQTSVPISTARQFANLDNRSIQSQKYNDLVSRGIIQDKSLEGYSDWGYRDEEIGKGSKFYDPTHSRIQSILKPVRSTWNKYGKPVMGGIMSAVSGIPGMGLLLNSLRKDPYAANRIKMYGAYKDPSTGFMKDKFGYNVGTTLMKNRFLEPGSNSYRSYALDALKNLTGRKYTHGQGISYTNIAKKNALDNYYQKTYNKSFDDVYKSHQQKKDPFGDTTLGGYEGSDLGFAASQQHGTDTSGSFAGKGTGNPFGHKDGGRMARGGIAGLWPR